MSCLEIQNNGDFIVLSIVPKSFLEETKDPLTRETTLTLDLAEQFDFALKDILSDCRVAYGWKLSFTVSQAGQFRCVVL